MGSDAGIEPSRLYPPEIGEQERGHLIQTVKDWSIGHGLVVRPPPTVIAAEADTRGITAVPAPVTLFPSGLARHAFRQGLAAQKAYNELYAAVSRDEKFLAQIVKEVIDGDDFVRDLWAVHETVKSEGYTQPLSLGLFRSDYMAHHDPSIQPGPFYQLKQVEFNTIAASFAGLSVRTCQLHNYLAKTQYPLLQQATSGGTLDLPDNKAVEKLAGGIEAAYNAYGAPQANHTKCVVFLVQGTERNVWDQRHLEYQLAQASPPIPVFRVAFSDVLRQTRLAKTEKRQLLYAPPFNPEGNFEVAVIYMRSGYGPGDYPNQEAWTARCHLERSYAIKCPSVLTQLAGTKKVQQVLATPRTSKESILSEFIKEDTPSAVELRKTFTNIFPMDTSDVGLEAREKALDPVLCRDYVLKPQREGGGNNIYGSAIPAYLKGLPDAHWNSYILMELIKPSPSRNFILRNGRLEEGNVISELGVYGACLWHRDTGEVLHNEEAGWLLRTKGDQSEEGGVAAGFGCMDSVSLLLTGIDVQEDSALKP